MLFERHPPNHISRCFAPKKYSTHGPFAMSKWIIILCYMYVVNKTKFQQASLKWLSIMKRSTLRRWKMVDQPNTVDLFSFSNDLGKLHGIKLWKMIVWQKECWQCSCVGRIWGRGQLTFDFLLNVSSENNWQSFNPFTGSHNAVIIFIKGLENCERRCSKVLYMACFLIQIENTCTHFEVYYVPEKLKIH